jgi:hypothetical protein
MASGIPDPVRQLIAQHIESVEQLEVLLHLRANADRTWTADEVAQNLHIQPDSAERRLDDLRARGFFAVEENRYRYSPAQPAMDALVGGLAQVYSTHRVSVISLIFSKPTDTIQTFADAFRFRPREED